jgi:hypothetical protein
LEAVVQLLPVSAILALIGDLSQPTACEFSSAKSVKDRRGQKFSVVTDRPLNFSFITSCRYIPGAGDEIRERRRGSAGGIAPGCLRLACSLGERRELILKLFPCEETDLQRDCGRLEQRGQVTMRKSYGIRIFRVLELALYHSLGDLPELESGHDFS